MMAARSRSGSTSAGGGDAVLGGGRFGRFHHELEPQPFGPGPNVGVKPGGDQQAVHAGRGDNPLERRFAAIDRKGDRAQAGADRAQIGGDEEGAVFGEQADAVAAGRALRPQPAVPCASRRAKLSVRNHLTAVIDGGGVALRRPRESPRPRCRAG